MITRPCMGYLSEQSHPRKRAPTLDRGGSLRYLDPVDINTILTIYSAPTDAKDLILALATGMRDLRENNRTLTRELESVRMALDSMTNAHDLLLEDLNPCVSVSLRIERDDALARLAALEADVKHQAAKPVLSEPGSSLDDLLRYAVASKIEVRVTLAGPCEDRHDGTREGVPRWDPDSDGDRIPWYIDDWYCGINGKTPDERIVKVELL